MRGAVEAWRPRYREAEDARKAERKEIIERVRAVVQEARRAGATIDLSGVPAIVVEMDSTTLIETRHAGTVDAAGNILIMPA